VAAADSARSPTLCSRARSATSARPRPRSGDGGGAMDRTGPGTRARFVTEQPPCSILVPGIEAEVPPTCAKYGMGVMTYSPLSGGWLSGRWRQGSDQPGSTRAERLPARCRPTSESSTQPTSSPSSPTRPGIPLIQLATAFVANHPAVTARSSGRARWSTLKPASRGGRRLGRAAARPRRRDRRAGHEPSILPTRASSPAGRTPPSARRRHVAV